MSLIKYIHQLKEPIDLRELTISPFYQQKGTFNPYYTVDSQILKLVQKDIEEKDYSEILFKNVEKGQGNLMFDMKGKFEFQIVIKKGDAEIETKQYIKIPKKFVKSHYGMKQRKDSTASSNVNEYLSMYFLAHTEWTDAETFMQNVAKLSGGTGVYTGENKEVSYEELLHLLIKTKLQ